MKTNNKFNQFRLAMKVQAVEAYIVPSSDPHQSEYVAAHWKARAWISGFTGSAGTAVITAKAAGVWTDSRYFIQAEQELEGSEVELHKVYNQGSPQFLDWIIENLEEGDTVGCDGSLFSKNQINRYEKSLKSNGIFLNANLDLIDQVWNDRPALPEGPIFELSIDYCGESRSEKLSRIRSEMKKTNAELHLVSTLDDIAWIFNIRGSDVTYNPVAVAYAVIEEETALLFIDTRKVTPTMLSDLHRDGISVREYKDIWSYLNEISDNKTIWIDENCTSFKLYKSINTGHIVNKQLPSINMKAIKNDVEIGHFKRVMERDGVALVKFYRWLEANIEKGISEFDCVGKLAEFRATQDGYHSESFGAIVGYRENGAIVHYRPSNDTSAVLKAEGLLLVDSGGQYLDGTTDITRTISLGIINEEEKNAYTRVLKGNIALDRAIYPKGTLGVQLDTLARVHLWEDRLNFLHGTGHGIGFFLNVHEGPQGFHPGIASRSRNAILENMVTTNEPGFYQAGKFGIRIENCLLTVAAGSTDSGEFLKFETLTLFPIDTNLINFSILLEAEKAWLNNYHQIVFARLSPHLDAVEKAWLREKCKEV